MKAQTFNKVRYILKGYEYPLPDYMITGKEAILRVYLIYRGKDNKAYELFHKSDYVINKSDDNKIYLKLNKEPTSTFQEILIIKEPIIQEDKKEYVWGLRKKSNEYKIVFDNIKKATRKRKINYGKKN